MSANLLTVPERVGRTFGTAVRVLGVIAVIQILVALWAILIRFDGQAVVPITQTVPVQSASLTYSVAPVTPAPQPAAPVSPVPADVAVTRQEGAGMASTTGDMAGSELMPPGIVAGLPPIESLPGSRARTIGNPRAEELVNLALGLRARGDTQGALQNLREASTLVSDHPRILAELATTYGQIGLEDKETDLWQKVLDMGLTDAGVYYTYAEEFFDGNMGDRGVGVDTVLKVANTSLVEDAEVASGERRLLTIYLEASPGVVIDPTDMVLEVFFYDLVDGADFDLTIADTRQHLPSEPYDWAGGNREIVEMEYILPELKPEQIAELGRRSFYGYVIKLYYQDVLQDMLAEPRKLGQLDVVERPSLFPSQG